MNYMRSPRGFRNSDLRRVLNRVSHSHLLDGVRVACVDDREDFLQVTRKFLELKGATVVSWLDPIIALQEIDVSVDLVISDYDMPGMKGTEFISKLRQKNPRLKAIIASGHFLDQIPSIGVPILHKPWKPLEMEALIKQILGITDK